MKRNTSELLPTPPAPNTTTLRKGGEGELDGFSIGGNYSKLKVHITETVILIALD